MPKIKRTEEILSNNYEELVLNIAEHDDADGQYIVGMQYLAGKVRKANGEQAIFWLQKAANQGHTMAQWQLGVCYDTGNGVECDHTQAVEWYRLSADQGYAPAQFNLGYCYNKGHGVEQNMERAVHYYTLSAQQNNESAQFYLAGCYERGEGVDRDIVMAFHWYVRAGAQGNEVAQKRAKWLQSEVINMPYESAQSLQSKYNDAKKLFDNANGNKDMLSQALETFAYLAKQGYAVAQNMFAYCLFFGKGVQSDADKAIYWWQLAAEQEHVGAQYWLGVCYKSGYGSLQKDLKQAKYWFKKAADQGHANAERELSYLK